MIIERFALRCLTVAFLFTFLCAIQVRAQAIQVRIMGQSSSFSKQDSAAISSELNSILSAATGYAGSSSTSTTLGGRALAEGFYHPAHRATTRAALNGSYNYLVILPETGFLASYPEFVFEGVLQMSRRALNVGAIPLLLMPATSNTEVSSFGPQAYRIANGCGIDAVPGGYATQAGGLLAPTTPTDTKRQAYLLAATLFTKITGLNAASNSSYVPTVDGSPIDSANLATIAATTVNTHLNTLHYSTSRETTGAIRYRPFTPANNTVRYAWTGSSTETGIKDALTPMLIASGYSVSDARVSFSQGWNTTIFEEAKPIFAANPNQYLFAYGRTGAITLSGQSLINFQQANLIPFTFDRHLDNPGSGTASINNMLDDIYDRNVRAEFENRFYGWAIIPFHLGIARLNDVDPAIVFSNDNVHVTSPLYNMMASMMVTSALGREPTPTASILANPEDLKGFNVGKQTIKQLAFLAESESFVPDTKLSIVGVPSLGVTKGVTVDYTFSALNGTPPFTWTEQSSVGLPLGLTLSPNGRLSGVTSANPGSWKLVLNVRDSTGAIRKLPQTLAVTALPAGTSAFLTALTPSGGTLAPAFDSNVSTYTATVPPATSTLNLTPIAVDSTATIRVNGSTVASGSPSSGIPLDFGPNVITTEVVSQNLAQTKSYTLTVTRAAFSSNADLAGIIPSVGLLSPSFSSNIPNYAATVFDITQLTVTPTAADAYALIRVNGNVVTSGSASAPILINTGNNPISIEVRSSDLSNARTYLLTVTQERTDIASDTFTGKGNGTALVGTSLETSLSGGGWVTQFGIDSRSFSSTTTAGFGNPFPGSFGNGGQSVSAVSIASAGAYVKPTILIISADLAPAPPGFTGAVGAAFAGRGIALGYYSSLSGSTQFSQNRFTGLVLDAAGNLNLIHDPNATGFFGGGSVLSTPIAFVGTWDPSVLRRLSYTVNTTTGAISNISLEGSSASYSFATTLFTDAATNLAGAYVSSESNQTLAAMDNFLVSSKPSADPFADWMSTNYPTILAPDNQPGADPDNDGIENLIEYVLRNGNPSVSTTDTLPTLDASGANFVFTYFRRTAATGTTQTFEHGSDLIGWTPVAIPGGLDVIITPDDPSAGIDKVEITVARGTNTQLFGRLQVTQP